MGHSDNIRSRAIPALVVLAAVNAGLFYYASTVFWDIQRQIIFGWIVILIIILTKRFLKANKDLQRVILILFSLLLAVRYWIFRTTDTLVFYGVFDILGMTALYLAESYGILTYILGMVVNIFPIRRKIVPVDLNDPDLPTVDVFIPTYNEPEMIVGITATAASQIDYPKDKLNVYILDDGGTLQKRSDSDPVKAKAAQRRHENLKALAEYLEIRYMTRDRNVRAKAGNINDALLRSCPDELKPTVTKSLCTFTGFEMTAGDLILILDCDHVPTRDILKNTVGEFVKDDKVFLVQTPHFFINPDPVERNLMTYLEKPSENEMFYGGVQLGLDFWNASFFCGSAAIMRRSMLTEIGGIAGETITEDAETALTLHAKGYKSVYIARPMVCGLSPESFSDFILQRSRWAQGMTQILMLKNPLFIKGLSLFQRLCYFNTCIFWFFGLARFVFFIAPLLYLFFGLTVYNASLAQIFAYAIPHIVAAIMLTDYMFGDLRHPFFSELYEVVQSIFNVPAVVSVMFRPRSPSFKVTPKEQSFERETLSPLAFPFYIMLLFTLAAYPFGVLRFVLYPMEHDAVFITLFWTSFNLLLILLCLGAVWEKRQRRKKHRINTRERISVSTGAASEAYLAWTIDLSEDGIGFETALKAPFKPGTVIEILAEDSSGHSYNLPAKVVRTFRKGDRMGVGCEFLGQDGLSWMEIVTYVYGDSRRWDEFWKLRRRHRTNAWRGVGYLCKKGVQGSVANFSGLFMLLLRKIGELGVRLWKRRPLRESRI